MKLSILALALVSTAALAQNSSIPLDSRYVMTRSGLDAQKAETANPQLLATAQIPERRSYALPPQAPRATAQAPEWFVRLPDDTAEMLFAAGTGSSTDEQMAYDKARMAAERKLVEMMGANVRSLTKSYRADMGEASVEKFETVTRKTANGDLVGAQRVDSQATFDGRVYKVYVLVRYPLGEQNSLRKEREVARTKRETEFRAGRAHQELDQAQEVRRNEVERDEQTLRSNVAPVVVGPSSSTTAVITKEGKVIELLDVDNTEYKKKREEALAKPGAVVGQTTLR